ncbi:TPA: hypothetical protein QEL76_000253 [Stenotrophomonas maltophilia]|nr:hypothetical protein [Stenotrophomonas maltophilia]
MATDGAWDSRNNAHKVLQARREICKRLRERLKEINSELDRIDDHARSNEGRAAHPPVVKRTAVDVLLDKANTEAAIAIAEKRAAEAEVEFDRLNAPLGED